MNRTRSNDIRKYICNLLLSIKKKKKLLPSAYLPSSASILRARAYLRVYTRLFDEKLQISAFVFDFFRAEPTVSCSPRRESCVSRRRMVGGKRKMRKEGIPNAASTKKKESISLRKSISITVYYIRCLCYTALRIHSRCVSPIFKCNKYIST